VNRLLDTIDSPKDLRQLDLAQLPLLANEVREQVISVVSEIGGHFASTLGVVELTVALHYAFDTPEDRLLWDTGHQAYAHKLICGRRQLLKTIRQLNGVSGFLRREESVYDAFGAGHAGTAISAALGMIVARDLDGQSHKVVAVVNDGSLTAGLSFEALNQVGQLKKNLVIVLNDNSIFIDPRVGAISALLSKQLPKERKRGAKKTVKNLPTSGNGFWPLPGKIKNSLHASLTPAVLFEALGIQYVGPIDGYDLAAMIETFKKVKDLPRPVLVHVTTTKGKGYKPAEEDPVKYHSVTPFHVLTGKRKDEKKPIPTYTEIVSRTLIRLAKENRKLFAITAAMASGTGIDTFAREIPDRACDVGVAEQHAVTFAAGLATEGWIPIVAIYSTFLQRAYDQIIHDVCLQNLHVVFMIDRGGLVGADGPTHHGVFDLSYMRHIPNLIVMVPKDENELQQMIKTAVEHEGPVCIRYPRGEGWGVELDDNLRTLDLGKAELLQAGDDLVILALGQTVVPALKAARNLFELGIDAAVINARFVKPLDRELIVETVSRSRRLITVEDNVLQGGFGSAVTELLADEKLKGVHVKRLGVPDRFIPQGTQDELRRLCGIDQQAICAAGIEMMKAAENELLRSKPSRRLGSPGAAKLMVTGLSRKP
jgi:1-deoxy-D-xylulose-5-phosphate synthase